MNNSEKKIYILFIVMCMLYDLREKNPTKFMLLYSLAQTNTTSLDEILNNFLNIEETRCINPIVQLTTSVKQQSNELLKWATSFRKNKD